MSIAPSQLMLYAADAVDLSSALAVAALVNLPASQVTGDFTQAWNAISQGQTLVLAVGGPANAALYYNPCGWSNPENLAAGTTPFTAVSGPSAELLPLNSYLNGAGANRVQTFYRAAWLAAYALGAPLSGWGPVPPPAVAPQDACAPTAAAMVRCPCHSPRPASSGGVGVYATFASVAAVQAALADGWPGLATTAGLGTPQAPYTGVLAPNGDAFIAQALASVGGEALPFWLSFWTVSAPAGNDSFYDAGFVAGQYAATTIEGYPSPYLPNYVVLDPEGYNAPPGSPEQWNQWLMGWAGGIWSVDLRLQPAVYVNQSQYLSGALAQLALPAIIAVSPIADHAPIVSGPNILGYHGFYASCPAESSVRAVAAWGGRYNLVQFPDSGVDCAP